MPAMVQIEFWGLITFLAGLLLSFFGAAWSAGKVMARQFNKRLDEKFKAQEAAREAGAKALRETIERYTAQGERTAQELKDLERDFLKWRADLPEKYVRRDDYLRGQTVLEAKLDAVYDKLEMVRMKGVGNGN